MQLVSLFQNITYYKMVSIFLVINNMPISTLVSLTEWWWAGSKIFSRTGKKKLDSLSCIAFCCQ